MRLILETITKKDKDGMNETSQNWTYFFKEPVEDNPVTVVMQSRNNLNYHKGDTFELKSIGKQQSI